MKNRSSRRKSGFTLSEVLVTVLIFSLVSVVMAAGISASAKVYRSSIQTSEAQTLCNTLSQTMTSIIHNSRDASSSATLTNDFYGEDVSFSSEDGKICLGGKTIMGSGAYGKNLDADVTCSCSGSVFTIDLVVKDRLSGSQLTQAQFAARVPED